MVSIFSPKEKQIQKVISIPINSIIPNRAQPRIEFDPVALNSLAESIRADGILQPISVRRQGVMYEIISGERRIRAAEIAGLKEVPCIVVDADDEKSAVLALIENIQRCNLGYFEEALAIEKLISVYGLTQESAAARLGKAQSTIANKLRLLKFTDSERMLLITKNIGERQARSIIRITDNAKRKKILDEVISHGLNIVQTEELVDRFLESDIRTKPAKKPKRTVKIPFPRLYINSLNNLVKSMRESNIDCETSTVEENGYFEYTIKIPIDKNY
ncbi:MAG: ParB/RepB/Spo0J family partition protein [Oscillospiraceae bacterium]